MKTALSKLQWTVGINAQGKSMNNFVNFFGEFLGRGDIADVMGCVSTTATVLSYAVY